MSSEFVEIDGGETLVTLRENWIENWTVSSRIPERQNKDGLVKALRKALDIERVLWERREKSLLKAIAVVSGPRRNARLMP